MEDGAVPAVEKLDRTALPHDGGSEEREDGEALRGLEVVDQLGDGQLVERGKHDRDLPRTPRRAKMQRGSADR
jgi:hypothetical protein